MYQRALSRKRPESELPSGGIKGYLAHSALPFPHYNIHMIPATQKAAIQTWIENSTDTLRFVTGFLVGVMKAN